MLETYLARTRESTPLVHSITNVVTVNDVANVLLACGARPIMADALQELEEIVGIATALYINIGTLNERTIESMCCAVSIAHRLGKPIILDPVGVGASQLRTQTVQRLLETAPMTVIRGNVSEIRAIADGTKTRGVDSNASDEVTTDTLDGVIALTQRLSHNLNCVIATTGAIDVVSYQQKSYCIANGHPKMSDVTGTGCQSTAMIAAYVAASPDNALEATAAAIATMGIAGEIAHEHLAPHEGNSTYRNRIIDAIDTMTMADFTARIQLERK